MSKLDDTLKQMTEKELLVQILRNQAYLLHKIHRIDSAMADVYNKEILGKTDDSQVDYYANSSSEGNTACLAELFDKADDGAISTKDLESIQDCIERMQR